MPEFILSRQAETDLSEIWAYIAEDNELAANKLAASFVDTFEILANNPEIGTDRPELGVDLQHFPHKRYRIFYTKIDNGVEIYRVLHHSRDTDALFEDL
ncbi:MAG: type II toxin-antitoxin system RelE/ParE family toxin [Acidobacteriota bacterium]|nr:MAG: type II toxin-antitoxin system RelE/ParE family toxin [Acidobacteriota bacterium]